MNEKLQRIIDDMKKSMPVFRLDLMKLVFKRDTRFPYMATDGKSIFYNEEWVNRVDNGTIRFVIIHEICHIWMMHPHREARLNIIDRKISMIAADCEINCSIIEDFPQDGKHLWANKSILWPGYGSLRSLPWGETYEKYVELIRAEAERKADDLANGLADKMEEILDENQDEEGKNGSGDSGADEGMESRDGSNTTEADGDQQVDQESSEPSGSGGADGQDGESEGSKGIDASDAKSGKTPGDGFGNQTSDGEINRDFLKRVYMNQVLDKMAGKAGNDVIPADTDSPTGEEMIDRDFRLSNALQNAPTNSRLAKVLGEVVHGKRDWRKILQKYVETIPINIKRSYVRPNRKAGDFILPSTHRDEALNKIAILIDCSASMQDTCLRMFKHAVDITSVKFSEIMVGCFDTDLLSIYKLRNKSDAESLQKKFHFVGGGGTDVSSSFTYCKKNNYRLIIVLTDGEMRCPPDPGIPVIWMGPIGDHWAKRLTYGEIIKERF